MSRGICVFEGSSKYDTTCKLLFDEFGANRAAEELGPSSGFGGYCWTALLDVRRAVNFDAERLSQIEELG